MDINVITHYYADDTDCYGDYAAVSIEIDGIEIIQFGDHYHDKGREQAEGFIYACKHFHPSCIVTYRKIADYNG